MKQSQVQVQRATPSPRVRQTQRFAADRLLEVLRRTTALVDDGPVTVEEALQLATSAVVGLSEELALRQRSVDALRGDVAAAYRSAAIAAADEVEAARRSVAAAAEREAVASRLITDTLNPYMS